MERRSKEMIGVEEARINVVVCAAMLIDRRNNGLRIEEQLDNLDAALGQYETAMDELFERTIAEHRTEEGSSTEEGGSE